MKRLTAGISLLVPVAAGAVRWLDLVNFCDLTTGFVLLGPVWARYLCMAMVLSLGVLASFLAARRPSGLVRRSMSLGLLCLLAGGAFAALAGVQLAALLGGAEADVLETAQTVLYLLTALWLLLLGISRVAGSTVAPSGSAWTGILGTFAFYLLTVRRFCFNPSGIVRIVPTVQVFSALSALVLLQGAVKAFYLPHLPVGRGLFFRGYLAFFFCTCLEAPQAVCLYLGGQYTLAQLAEGLALGVIGLIGLRCAALTVGEEQPEQQEQPEAAEEEPTR
ncbi:MAG: hypothetical protein SPE95_01220 [Oscillospiraceae bacterium]|mgnify:FL=1|nr:hypothetical protein [Bacteroidales bacterium]MDD6998633.1 hypothetical protein [Oscillospiraceae bacterium]MDY5094885.1 hypothetical protein [Oscillospiraceae bacterium]